MKILCACEESQTVCKAFRSRGHEAYSCDIQECSGSYPEWHIQKDVIPLLRDMWDLVIAFPPCTNLAVSGARHFLKKRANGSQQKSIDFFMEFTKLKCAWAIENPVGIMSTIYRKPDQIVQPWMFGHPESKSTCLWLSRLPQLMATSNVKHVFDTLPRSKQQRIHYLPPSKDRAKIRSKTYTGIADAMADQWSELK